MNKRDRAVRDASRALIDCAAVDDPTADGTYQKTLQRLAKSGAATATIEADGIVDIDASPLVASAVGLIYGLAGLVGDAYGISRSEVLKQMRP